MSLDGFCSNKYTSQGKTKRNDLSTICGARDRLEVRSSNETVIPTTRVSNLTDCNRYLKRIKELEGKAINPDKRDRASNNVFKSTASSKVNNAREMPEFSHAALYAPQPTN